MTRRRRKQPSKDHLKAEKVIVKAEKKSAKVKSNVMAGHEARKTGVKLGKRTFEAEVEGVRGTRAKAVPPPKRAEPRRNQDTQPVVKVQKPLQQRDGGGNSSTAVKGAGGRWKKQLTRQERVKKLHQDLRIDENKMLRAKPVLKQKLKDLVDKYEDVFITVDCTVGMVPDRYETHICFKPGAKPKKQKLR